MFGTVRRVLRRIVPGTRQRLPLDVTSGPAIADADALHDDAFQGDAIQFAAEHLDGMFERLLALPPDCTDDAFAAILSAMAVLDQLHRDRIAAAGVLEAATPVSPPSAQYENCPLAANASIFPAIRETVPQYTPGTVEELPPQAILARKHSLYAYLPERPVDSDMLNISPSSDALLQLSSSDSPHPDEDCAVHLLSAIRAARPFVVDSPSVHVLPSGTRSTLGPLVDTPPNGTARAVLRRSLGAPCDLCDTPRAVGRPTLPASPTPVGIFPVSSVEELVAALEAGSLTEAL